MTDLRHAKPGMVVAHRNGTISILRDRKADGSGWWLVGGGGLIDSATESGDWLLLTPDVIRRLFTTPEQQAQACHYVSTYCMHGDHGACRLACKTCDAPCRCSCGHQTQSVDAEGGSDGR